MQDFSISFWVKANKNQPGISADAVGLITRWDQSKVRDAFGVWIKGGEWAGVCVWPRGGTWDMTGYFQKQIWQHVACSYSKEPLESVFCINGGIKQRLELRPFQLRPSDLPILVGADNSSGTYWRFFSGQIDDVRIYNRALSEAQVKALYEFEKAN